MLEARTSRTPATTAVRTAAAASRRRRRRHNNNVVSGRVGTAAHESVDLPYHHRERARYDNIIYRARPMTERNGRCSPAVKIADSSSGR